MKKKIKTLLAAAGSLGLFAAISATGVSDSSAKSATETPASTPTSNPVVALPDYKVYPGVQQINYGGNNTYSLTDTVNIVYDDSVSEATIKRFENLLKSKHISNITRSKNLLFGKTNILIGIKGDSDNTVDNLLNTVGISPSELKDSSSDNAADLFSQNDAYYLRSSNNFITLYAKDADAAFYGATTLWHIFKQIDGSQLRNFTIKDWADREIRGLSLRNTSSISTLASKLDLINYAGYLKYNRYYYQPQTDLKTTTLWSSLYTQDELKDIKTLIKATSDNGMKFVYFINPFVGSDKITAANMNDKLPLLKTKIQQLLDVGVKDIVIATPLSNEPFADAVSTTGTLSQSDYTTIGNKQKAFLDDLVKWWNEQSKRYDDLDAKIGYLDYRNRSNPKNGSTSLKSYYDQFNSNVQLYIDSGTDWPNIDGSNNFTAGNKKIIYIQNWHKGESSLDYLMLGINQFWLKTLQDISDNNPNKSNYKFAKIDGIAIDPNQMEGPSKVTLFDFADYAWKRWVNNKLTDSDSLRIEQRTHLNALNFAVDQSYNDPQLTDALYNISTHFYKLYWDFNRTWLSNGNFNYNFKGFPVESTDINSAPNFYLGGIGDSIRRGIDSVSRSDINGLRAKLSKLVDDINYVFLAAGKSQLVLQTKPWLQSLYDLANAGIIALDATTAYKNFDFVVFGKLTQEAKLVYNRSQTYKTMIKGALKAIQISDSDLNNFVSNLTDFLTNLHNNVLATADNSSLGAVQKTFFTNLGRDGRADWDPSHLEADNSDSTFTFDISSDGKYKRMKKGDYFGYQFSRPITLHNVYVKMWYEKWRLLSKLKLQYQTSDKPNQWQDLQENKGEKNIDITNLTVSSNNPQSVAGSVSDPTATWGTTELGESGIANVTAIRIVNNQDDSTSDNMLSLVSFIVNKDETVNYAQDLNPSISSTDSNSKITLVQASENVNDKNSTSATNGLVLQLANNTNLLFDNSNGTANGIYLQTPSGGWQANQSIGFKLPEKMNITQLYLFQTYQNAGDRMNDFAVEYLDGEPSTGEWKQFGFGHLNGSAIQTVYGNATFQYFRLVVKGTHDKGSRWTIGNIQLESLSNEADLKLFPTTGLNLVLDSAITNNKLSNLTDSNDATFASFKHNTTGSTQQTTIQDNDYFVINFNRPAKVAEVKIKQDPQAKVSDIEIQGLVNNEVFNIPSDRYSTTKDAQTGEVTISINDHSTTTSGSSNQTTANYKEEWTGLKVIAEHVVAQPQAVAVSQQATDSEPSSQSQPQPTPTNTLTHWNIKSVDIIERRVNISKYLLNHNGSLSTGFDGKEFDLYNKEGTHNTPVTVDLKPNDSVGIDFNSVYKLTSLSRTFSVADQTSHKNVVSSEESSSGGEQNSQSPAPAASSTSKAKQAADEQASGTTENSKTMNTDSLKDIKVQYSLDGFHWTDVAINADNTDVSVAKNARFVRVINTGRSNVNLSFTNLKAKVTPVVYTVNDDDRFDTTGLTPKDSSEAVSAVGIDDAHSPEKMIDRDATTFYQPKNPNSQILYRNEKGYFDNLDLRIITDTSYPDVSVSAQYFDTKDNTLKYKKLGELSRSDTSFTIPRDIYVTGIQITWGKTVPKITELFGFHNKQLNATDKTQLSALITKDPDYISQWSKEDQDRYNELKAQAKQIVSKDFLATQELVDTVYFSMQNVIKYAKVTLTPDQVASASANVISNADNQYTDQSYEQYQDAVTALQNAVADPNSLTEPTYNQLLANVKTAQDSLKPSVFARDLVKRDFDTFEDIKAQLTHYNPQAYAKLADFVEANKDKVNSPDTKVTDLIAINKEFRALMDSVKSQLTERGAKYQDFVKEADKLTDIALGYHQSYPSLYNQLNKIISDQRNIASNPNADSATIDASKAAIDAAIAQVQANIDKQNAAVAQLQKSKVSNENGVYTIDSYSTYTSKYNALADLYKQRAFTNDVADKQITDAQKELDDATNALALTNSDVAKAEVKSMLNNLSSISGVDQSLLNDLKTKANKANISDDELRSLLSDLRSAIVDQDEKSLNNLKQQAKDALANITDAGVKADLTKQLSDVQSVLDVQKLVQAITDAQNAQIALDAQIVKTKEKLTSQAQVITDATTKEAFIKKVNDANSLGVLNALSNELILDLAPVETTPDAATKAKIDELKKLAEFLPTQEQNDFLTRLNSYGIKGVSLNLDAIENSLLANNPKLKEKLDAQSKLDAYNQTVDKLNKYISLLPPKLAADYQERLNPVTDKVKAYENLYNSFVPEEKANLDALIEQLKTRKDVLLELAQSLPQSNQADIISSLNDINVYGMDDQANAKLDEIYQKMVTIRPSLTDTYTKLQAQNQTKKKIDKLTDDLVTIFDLNPLKDSPVFVNYQQLAKLYANDVDKLTGLKDEILTKFSDIKTGFEDRQVRKARAKFNDMVSGLNDQLKLAAKAQEELLDPKFKQLTDLKKAVLGSNAQQYMDAVDADAQKPRLLDLIKSLDQSNQQDLINKVNAAATTEQLDALKKEIFTLKPELKDIDAKASFDILKDQLVKMIATLAPDLQFNYYKQLNEFKDPSQLADLKAFKDKLLFDNVDLAVAQDSKLIYDAISKYLQKNDSPTNKENLDKLNKIYSNTNPQVDYVNNLYNELSQNSLVKAKIAQEQKAQSYTDALNNINDLINILPADKQTDLRAMLTDSKLLKAKQTVALDNLENKLKEIPAVQKLLEDQSYQANRADLMHIISFIDASKQVEYISQMDALGPNATQQQFDSLKAKIYSEISGLQKQVADSDQAAKAAADAKSFAEFKIALDAQIRNLPKAKQSSYLDALAALNAKSDAKLADYQTLKDKLLNENADLKASVDQQQAKDQYQATLNKLTSWVNALKGDDKIAAKSELDNLDNDAKLLVYTDVKADVLKVDPQAETKLSEQKAQEQQLDKIKKQEQKLATWLSDPSISDVQRSKYQAQLAKVSSKDYNVLESDLNDELDNSSVAQGKMTEALNNAVSQAQEEINKLPDTDNKKADYQNRLNTLKSGSYSLEKIANLETLKKEVETEVSRQQNVKPEQTKPQPKSNGGVIAGVVIAVLASLAAILGLIFHLKRRKNKK
ncbi:beta-N-acetylglucosaminidase domain-containing protein [Mycoplasma sp. 4013]